MFNSEDKLCDTREANFQSICDNEEEKEDEVEENTLKGFLQERNFVVMSWNNQSFPGVVLSTDYNGTVFKCMEPMKRPGNGQQKKNIYYITNGVIRKGRFLPQVF